MSDWKKKVAIVRRDPQTARAIEQILQLPNDAWTSVEVDFGLDDIAVAKVGFILTSDQLIALANLSVPKETS